MERRVTRAGAGAGDWGALLGGSQFTGRPIEAEDEHAVQAPVRHDYRAASGVEHHVMWMGTDLLDAMRSGLPRKSDHLHGVGEPTIGPDGQHCHVARAVIGHHQKAAAGVDGLVHAVAPAGFSAIQRIEKTIGGIYRERSGIAFVAVHRIEVALIRCHHQE